MHNEIIVTDSGPIIHLSQIDTDFAWKIFPKVYVPDIVQMEVTKFSLPGSNIFKDKRFKINTSNKNIQDIAKKFHKKYKMSKNDSIILAHAKSIKADLLLLTDEYTDETASRIPEVGEFEPWGNKNTQPDPNTFLAVGYGHGDVEDIAQKCNDTGDFKRIDTRSGTVILKNIDAYLGDSGTFAFYTETSPRTIVGTLVNGSPAYCSYDDEEVNDWLVSMMETYC